MNQLLHNPVYNALLTGDEHLSDGNDRVKFFDEEVSPFAGFSENNETGFSELHDLLAPGRKILYATVPVINQPSGWEFIVHIQGLQFVYDAGSGVSADLSGIVPLELEHVEQMVALARLTKPGPFGTRTIEFGSYYGIFEKEKLVAMTGQRLHVQECTEVSAVCTDPAYLGKGYAYALVLHAVALIRQQGKTPFLHVRADNQRAIALYERIGFAIRGNMNFYVMKKDAKVD